MVQLKVSPGAKDCRLSAHINYRQLRATRCRFQHLCLPIPIYSKERRICGYGRNGRYDVDRRLIGRFIRIRCDGHGEGATIGNSGHHAICTQSDRYRSPWRHAFMQWIITAHR